MYGSSLTIVTLRPRASSSAPTDALASPFPIEETTPPVTNTNLVGLRLIDTSDVARWRGPPEDVPRVWLGDAREPLPPSSLGASTITLRRAQDSKTVGRLVARRPAFL